MKRYHIIEPGAAYAATVYGRNKREARAAFRKFLYPHGERERLPAGTAIWESPE